MASASFMFCHPNNLTKFSLAIKTQESKTLNAEMFSVLNMNISERIKQRMQALGMKRAAELVKATGVSKGTVSQWLSDSSDPTGPNLLKLAKVLSVHPDWLLTGEGPEPNAIESKLVAVEWESSSQDKDEFITVPLIDVELSAGNGAPAIVEVEQYELPFRRYTLNKQGVSPNCAKVARVTGSSMSPLLNDGDVVGIDTSKIKVVDGDTYAIRDGDLLRVKILINRPDGGIVIRSYNREDYPDETLTREERQDRVTVLGRVWWSSKLW